MTKNYCENCKYIELYEAGLDEDNSLSLAKCLLNPVSNTTWPIAKRFEKTAEHRYCSTSRIDCPDECPKFEEKTNAIT